MISQISDDNSQIDYSATTWNRQDSMVENLSCGSHRFAVSIDIRDKIF